VLPSDHHVADLAGFHRALERAVEVAATGPITTIGIEPTRPETGFGYLELGEATGAGVHRVLRFEEKPDPARAREFVASGRHLWNAGMFFFSARAMFHAVEHSLPELSRGLARIEAAARVGPQAEAACTREVFAGLPSISIDHGVMERQHDLRVVPASFGWSDLGSWQSAWELASRDEHDNAVDPGTICLHARGNLVCDRSGRSGRAIVLLGVDDLCVVETEDALLVMPRARAQEVRDVVAALRDAGAQDKL
jgi:mannose-1-phosphate guanylyltransferase